MHRPKKPIPLVEPPVVGPDEPAGSAVRSAVLDGVQWLRLNHAKAGVGDEKGVHQLRTTTRRLRSSISLYRPLIDATWADGLIAELKWLGGALGEARDLDVMSARLSQSAGEAVDTGELAPLFERLGEKRGRAAQSLVSALQSDRYETLIGSLGEAEESIPLIDDASEPCRGALPRLVLGAWESLKRLGRAVAPNDPDDDFHEVRKRAKRARYAAEAVKGALDPDSAEAASAFARHARRVQDVLGAHQDAVVAAAEVKGAAEARPADGRFNFAAGRLHEAERRAADASRTLFFKQWRALDRKKYRRWLGR